MDPALFSISTCSQFEVWNNEVYSILCAIKNNQLDYVKSYFSRNKIHVNIPIIISGPLAGYTALHIACVENKLDLVKMLVEDFKADVNAVAADGIQPLIIAGLLGHLDIVEILLKANANVDALFGQEIQSKFVIDEVWCNDFGDKITLAIFAIMNDKYNLMRALINNSNPYLKFISSSNKTLMMYAIEKDNYKNAMVFVKIKDKEFLNFRDNDGLSAVDYLFHEKKYGEFRYDEKQFTFDIRKQEFVAYVYKGLDLSSYSTIHDDPARFIVNAAAYRGACSLLQYLLPTCTSTTQSKALYYATLPITDPKKCLRTYSDESSFSFVDFNRSRTIEYVVKDLVNRRTFGFFVPEEEKQLMDKLIATDPEIKDLVENYERTFIHGTLKNTVIKYGDKSITHFDFVKEVGTSDKKLRPFARDEDFVNEFSYEVFDYDDENYWWFLDMYGIKMKNILERIELKKALRNVPQLRKCIPLPYELVLEIIEYLNNDDLYKFIISFFE